MSSNCRVTVELLPCGQVVDLRIIDFRQTSDDAQDEHIESRGRGCQQSGRPVDVRDDSARRVDAEDGREERADAPDQRRPCPLFEVVSDSAQGCLLNRCCHRRRLLCMSDMRSWNLPEANTPILVP